VQTIPVRCRGIRLLDCRRREVWLFDENGTKTGDRRALNGGDPKAIAINLMRSKMFKRKSVLQSPAEISARLLLPLVGWSSARRLG
jgi:hypothetical protein